MEPFAIPFLEVPRWRMRPTREFGEPVIRSNSTTIGTEKAWGGLAQESVVLILRSRARYRVLVDADHLGGSAVG
jgi:hypothetical protein